MARFPQWPILSIINLSTGPATVNGLIAIAGGKAIGD
jgi:hypothetical protein